MPRGTGTRMNSARSQPTRGIAHEAMYANLRSCCGRFHKIRAIGARLMKIRHLVAGCIAALIASTPVLAQELNGTLKKIKDTGSVTMGIRESSFPLSYLDASQKPIGYHIDICQRIIDEIKTK